MKRASMDRRARFATTIALLSGVVVAASLAIVLFYGTERDGQDLYVGLFFPECAYLQCFGYRNHRPVAWQYYGLAFSDYRYKRGVLVPGSRSDVASVALAGLSVNS